MAGPGRNRETLPFRHSPVFISPDRVFPVMPPPLRLFDALFIDLDAEARSPGNLHKAAVIDEHPGIGEIIEQIAVPVVMDAQALPG